MAELSRQDDRLLESAAEVAFKSVAGGADIRGLPEWQRVFVTVYGVQPVIDNGGFQYVFEQDWPGCPSYREMSWAYRQIGAADVADWFDAAASLFPFPDAHRHREARVAYLREFCVKGDSPMGVLSGEAIDASDRVFRLLADYVRRHSARFGLR